MIFFYCFSVFLQNSIILSTGLFLYCMWITGINAIVNSFFIQFAMKGHLLKRFLFEPFWFYESKIVFFKRQLKIPQFTWLKDINFATEIADFCSIQHQGQHTSGDSDKSRNIDVI